MTKFSLISLFVLSALLSSALSVPFNLLNEDSNAIGIRETNCAKTCTDTDHLIKFQVGTTYSYNVDLITELTEQSLNTKENNNEDEQQVKIGAVADISVYGPCELVLKLRKVHLTGIASHRQMAEQLEAEPLHFGYDNGRIVDVCASTDDKPWTINVKKSILSALQMSANDVSQKDTIIETDISGQCETVYEPIETNQKQTDFVIRKVKQLNKCGQRHQSNIGFFPRSYPGLEQVIRSAMPLMNATYECEQKIVNSIVTETDCTDRQRLWPSTVEVESKIKLIKIDEYQNEMSIKMNLPANFQRHRLAMSANSWFVPNANQFDRKQHLHHRHHNTHNYQNQLINSITIDERVYSVDDVREIVQLICPKIVDSVEIDVAQLFSQLVEAKHSLNPLDEMKLFKQIKTQEICQSPKMADLYLDASALTGTEGSIEVLIYAYQHGLVTGSRASYLFSLLSFVKHPSVDGAQKLVEFLKHHYTAESQYQPQYQKQQLPRGVVLGISGYVHNLEQFQQHDQSLKQFVQEVVELFVQNLELCTVQLEKQRSINAGPATVGQCLTYVNALRNVGLGGSLPTVVDRLVKIVEQNPSAGNTNLNVEEVRIAIVRALLTGANDQIRHFLFEKVVKNSAESPEIQIEAYKTIVMSGTTRTQLQELKSYLEQIESTPNGRQLVNYVRSHQNNLRSTSDPHRQTILPVDAPVFPKPNAQKYGFSRNYEFSYVHEGLNVGFTAEADLVFPSTHQRQRSQFPVPVPHEMVFNLTVPVLGKEFQVVELRVHQHGMEQVIARQLRDMERNNKDDLWTVTRQMVSTIISEGADILSENPNVQLLLEVSVDGKTVVVADQHDLVADESDRNEILRDILETLQKRVSIDRAFAIKPIDTVLQMPTLNGMPIQFRLNSSLVFGLKTELNFDARDLSNSIVEFEMYPSVSAQWESAVEFYTGSEHKSIESVSRLYAAPQFNWKLEAKQGRMVSVKVELPKDRYTVARFESQLYTRNQNGERVRLTGLERTVRDNSKYYSQCSDLTKKPLGVAFCYDVEYTKQGQNSADLVAEMYLVKVDRQLRSYELYAEMPFSIEQLFNARRGLTYQDLMRQEKASIKFAFNTPGSQIDREIVMEIDLPTEGSASSEIEQSGRIRIQTPWKQIEAKALVRNQLKEKMIQAEVTVDRKQFFQMEMALESEIRGQKTEYRPRLMIKMASRMEPIHMTGVVSYSRGQKTKLYIMLEDVNQQRQYIKCTVVRNGDANASAHLILNLLGLETSVSTVVERTDRTLHLQFDSDYKTPFMRNGEKAKLALKLQNFSNGKVIKFANLGELSLSQYPKYNFIYQHNLMFDQSEQLEHYLKLGWNGVEQIRTEQMAKWTGLRGKYDVECKSVFVCRPKMIDYEVTGTAGLTGFNQSGPKRYEIVLIGQSQNDQKDADFKADLTYHHLSKSPLKMEMRAALKSNSIDFVYHDQIEEISENNYRGQLTIQLTPEQRYNTGYSYRVQRGENHEQQHELEVELKNPTTRFTARHHGMLRLVPDQLFHVKSKLVANDVDLCDGEIKLNKLGASHFEMNHYGRNLRGKLMVNPFSEPMTGNLEFENKLWKHDSNVEYTPEESLKFNSNTKRDNQHILTIESEFAPKQTSRFMLNSAPFKGQFDYNLNEMPNQKMANLEFSMPDTWSHQSKLEVKPHDQKVILQSKTRYQNYDLADLEAKYHPADEHYFRLTTPMAKTDFYAQMHHRNAQRKASFSLEAGKLIHDSQLEIEPDNDFQFVSQTKNNGRQLANLRYHLNDNVHNFELDSDDLLKAKAECNLAYETLKPYANIDLSLNNLEHKTKLVGERDTESIFLDSRTTKPMENDKTIAEIKASISKKAGHKSFATVRIGDHIQSNIELEPYKSAMFKLHCPHYIHKTEMNYEPTMDDIKNWNIQSETTSTSNQNKYNFGMSHRSNEKSEAKVQIPSFESELVYDHPEKEYHNHQVVFNFEGKTSAIPYEHKSEMKFVQDRYQQNHPMVQLKTKTVHKLTGSNLLELNGLYRHQHTELPSTFDLKLGRSVNCQAKLNPFNPLVKTLELEGEMRDQRTGKIYSHQTKLELHPELQALSVQSQTEHNGLNVAKLNTYLTTDQDKMSHFELTGAHDDYYTKFEMEPRKRRAMLNLVVKPYQHKTQISRSTDMDEDRYNHDDLFTGYRLNSETLKNRDSLFSLDTAWNRMDRPSHLKMKATGKFETEIKVHPERRFAEFGLKTDSIQHDSHFSMDDIESHPITTTTITRRFGRSIEEEPTKRIHIKSNTIFRDQTLANVDAKFHGIKGENVLNCDLPHFILKSSFNIPERKTHLDYISKSLSRRHILGSIYVNQDHQIQNRNNDRTFHADFAWDVDRNPESKVMIEFQVKQDVLPETSINRWSIANNQKLEILLQAQYGQNKLVLDTEFMPSRAFSHPIRSSLAFVPLDNYRTAEAWELVYTHKTDAESRFECELNYVVAQQVKYGVLFNGQVTEEFVKFNGQTKVPHNLSLQVSFNLEAGMRQRNQYYLIADAVHAVSNVYQAKFDIERKEAEQRYDGKVEFKLPNVETQLANFYVDLAEKKVHFEIVNEVNDKKVQLDLSYNLNLVHLTAASNIPYFPLVDLKVKVVPLRSIDAHIDLNGERKCELLVTYTGSVYQMEYEFLAKLTSIVTPTLELISAGNREESTVKVICKYNAEQIFVGQFKSLDQAGLINGKWLIEGLVSRHGGELARSTLQGMSDENEHKFIFQYKPIEPNWNQMVEPFSVEISGERQPDQIQAVSIKVTRAEKQFVDLDLVLKYPHQRQYRTYDYLYQSQYESIMQNIPEKVECVMRHFPSDRRVAFRVSLMEYLELNHNSQHSLIESQAKQSAVSSKVRNQLVFSLDEQSVGFVLISTNFESDYTAEHNLLVHSPINGRVMQYQTAYQMQPDYFLYLGQFKSDVRRPDPIYRYKLSMETDSESNYLINAELDSYKFRRSPKLISAVIRKPSTLRPVDAKVQIDVGRSESDIIVVETYVEEKRSNQIAYQNGLNTTAFFAVFTQDRIVDFSVDAHIADSSVGYHVKNVDFRGERREHYCQARFVDNQRFEIDLINPEHRFRVEGALKTNPTSESNLFVADFVVYQWYHDAEYRTLYRRSHPEQRTTLTTADHVHKIHFEATGKCVRAEIENPKLAGEVRQVNACFDLDKANIVNVAVDTIRNGEKVADLNVRLDTKSAANALKLYLHWNPEYARQIVKYLIGEYQYGNQYEGGLFDNELIRELEHKYTVLVQKLSQDLLKEPFVKIVIEEIVPILKELGCDLPQIEQFVRANFVQFVDYMAEYYQTMVYGFDRLFVQSYIQPLVQTFNRYSDKIEMICERSAFCRSTSKVFATLYNTDSSLSDLLVEELLETIQQTHRMIATSRNGRWLRSYLPEMSLPEPIVHLGRRALATVYECVRDSLESSAPLRKLVHHLESCYYEFVQSSALNSVNWRRIRNALKQTVELVLSPSTWYSSGRFVVYDPQTGDLQIELRSPLVQKTRVYADQYLNQSTPTTYSAYQPNTWYGNSHHKQQYRFGLF